LIRLVAILEHGDTTVLRQRSWTTKLHTTNTQMHLSIRSKHSSEQTHSTDMLKKLENYRFPTILEIWTTFQIPFKNLVTSDSITVESYDKDV
jgi:hypothetical protein